jgi:putative ABC transport system permease protein
VKQRTDEMGIRLALGAKPRDVIRPVAGRVAVGLATAAGLSSLTQSLLYDTSPTDPATFIGVPLILLGVALLAAFIPARRASRVDPVVALRRD